MSNAEKFQRDRWSLYVTFDPYEVEAASGTMENLLGEKAEFEAHVLHTFGGLPEEIHEILMHHEDGRVEVSVELIDYLHQLTDWLFSYTIPQEVKLVRNQERCWQ